MKKPRLTILVGLMAVVAIATIYWRAGANQPQATALQPDNPALVAQGGILYAESCASCHGDKLQGQPNWRQPNAAGRLPAPPHDETGHTWHHTDAVLFGLTKLGAARFVGLKNYETDMPVFKNLLSDAEIIAVLSYIKSTWPQQIQNRHNQMNQQNKKSD